MSAKSSLQGKAFEFAVLKALEQELSGKQAASIQANSALTTAESCFHLLSTSDQRDFLAAALAGIKMLIPREPRLCDRAPGCGLEIALQSDQKGGAGDVRDIIVLRQSDGWEIGMSAKNNHKAVKSQRLGPKIDFGQSWLQIPCSIGYQSSVVSIFQPLLPLVGQEPWRELERFGIRKHQVYVDLLTCFRDEFLAIYGNHGSIVPTRLIEYIVGRFDFYKIIKLKRSTQLQPFNLHGTLGLKAGKQQPIPLPAKLPLPTKIHAFDFADTETTLMMVCDAGWQISFRIHSASTLVESSLKFDVTLVGHPSSLVSQESAW